MTKKNQKKSNQYLWRHQCHRRRKGEGGPDTRAEVPLQPLGEDCGGAGYPPAAHGALQWSRDLCAVRGGATPCWSRWTCQEEGAACGGTTQEQIFWQELQLRIHAGVVCFWRTVPHGKEPDWNSLWSIVSCGRNWVLQQGNSVRRKEWQGGAVMGRCKPHSPSSCATWGKEVLKSGLKDWSLTWEEEEGESVFSLVFYFSLSYTVINKQ